MFVMCSEVPALAVVKPSQPLVGLGCKGRKPALEISSTQLSVVSNGKRVREKDGEGDCSI